MKLNDKLDMVNTMIMSSYPTARFYEVQGILDEVDGELKSTVSKMTVVYALPYGASLIVELDKGNEVPSMKIINEPWLEDRPMTPFVPMTLEEAFERLSSADYTVKSHTVVLRHILHPNINTPLYIFGDTSTGFISVNPYSGDVKIIE